MRNHQPTEPTQGATTLLEILDELRPLGFPGQLVAHTDGTVKCTQCSKQSAVEDFVVAGYRRIEGASDAADMNLVAWGACPACANGATVVLGYGPNASEADAAVLEKLALDRTEDPGATPDEADA